ncbi:MAG: hypothetical protein QOE55_685 [Acidobacteriaceae bacterium]|nr:hypothetical protein [Acidobacteriaceae bacterium]
MRPSDGRRRTNCEFMNVALKCYACDQPATTREHAPPICFFPKEHRINLITVPSCVLHNNANSLDVEYSRNVITTMFGTNEIAQRQFSDKVEKSFVNSPNLVYTTFADIRGVVFDRTLTGVCTVNTKRMERVMSACAGALHFRETGERKTEWYIVFPNLALSENAQQETVAAWSQFLSILGKMRLSKRTTSSPEVFKYAFADDLEVPAYGMFFYKAFSVFALATP